MLACRGIGRSSSFEATYQYAARGRARVSATSEAIS
jgi:hypothetical protein